MRETALHNGPQTNGKGSPRNALTPVSTSQQQQLIPFAGTNSQLAQLFGQLVSPTGQWVETIFKAIGPAEAEVEINERFRGKD